MIYATSQLRGNKGGLFKRLGRDRDARLAVMPPEPRAAKLIYMRWVRSFWALWRHVALNELEQANPDFAKRFGELLSVSGLPNTLQRTGVAVTDLVAGYMRSIFKRGVTPTSVRLDAVFGPDTQVSRLNPIRNAEQQAQIDDWRKENLRLIKNASDEHVAELAEIFKVAQENGLSHEELIGQVMKVLGTGESRARLIASDQTTKFNGTIQATQQQAAGITEFIWGTSRDGAVRPSHRELEGKTFSWAAPPVVEGEVATPGSPIRCRCQAIPKIALFAGIDDDEIQLPNAAPAVPAPVASVNALGLRNAQYLRSGMRDLTLHMGAYAGASATEAQQIALGEIPTMNEGKVFDPVRVTVESNGDIHLSDGRHRLTAAIASGASQILAQVIERGPRGGIKSSHIGPVRL